MATFLEISHPSFTAIIYPRRASNPDNWAKIGSVFCEIIDRFAPSRRSQWGSALCTCAGGTAPDPLAPPSTISWIRQWLIGVRRTVERSYNTSSREQLVTTNDTTIINLIISTSAVHPPYASLLPCRYSELRTYSHNNRYQTFARTPRVQDQQQRDWPRLKCWPPDRSQEQNSRFGTALKRLARYDTRCYFNVHSEAGVKTKTNPQDQGLETGLGLQTITSLLIIIIVVIVVNLIIWNCW